LKINVVVIATYQRGFLYNRAGMFAMTAPFLSHFCTLWAFFNAVAREPRWYVILSIAVVQPRWYLQYFLSRLHLSRFRNRAYKPYIIVIKCLFSTSELRNSWIEINQLKQ